MSKKNQKNQKFEEITVIGSGIAGISTAFHLAMLGYNITIIDPKVTTNVNRQGSLNGTEASLGILMGNVFRRSKGRSWLLRKRSLELWPNWISELKKYNNNIRLETPLLQLASSEEQYKLMVDLYHEKKQYGIELLQSESTMFWTDTFEKKQYGGLISQKDGRINPLECIQGILQCIKQYNVKS